MRYFQPLVYPQSYPMPFPRRAFKQEENYLKNRGWKKQVSFHSIQIPAQSLLRSGIPMETGLFLHHEGSSSLQSTLGAGAVLADTLFLTAEPVVSRFARNAFFHVHGKMFWFVMSINTKGKVDKGSIY